MTTETLVTLARNLDAELSGWLHGEECQRRWHEECCADEREEGGWWCEQGEARDECEPRDCECGIDKVKAMAAELAAALAP